MTNYHTSHSYTTDGTIVAFTLPFAGGWASKQHIKAEFTPTGGATSPLTVLPEWVTYSTLTISPALPPGTLRVYRATPADVPMYDFASAKVERDALNTALRQTLFAAAEASDAATSALALAQTAADANTFAAVDTTLAGNHFWGNAAVDDTAEWRAVSFLRADAKPLAIHKLTVSALSAGAVWLFSYTGTPTVPLVYSAHPANKRIGWPAASATSGGYHSAKHPTDATEFPGFSVLAQVYVPASTPVAVTLGTPLILPVGSAIAAHAIDTNREISLMWEFQEME